MYTVNRKGEKFLFGVDTHTHTNMIGCDSVQHLRCHQQPALCLIHMNYTVRSHLIHTHRTGLQPSPDHVIMDHFKNDFSRYNAVQSEQSAIWALGYGTV